jgi:hypothetical protein
MKNIKKYSFAAVLAGALLLGLPALSQNDDVPGVGEPGGPGRVLNPAEMEQWLRGRTLFDRPMHRSRGLGFSEMNADSCRACHQDPAVGGAGGLELNVSRFGFDGWDGTMTNGPFIDPFGGQGLSKLYPPWVLDPMTNEAGREEYVWNIGIAFEQRQTPSILGDGLIDGISDQEILDHQDPGDMNMDGIFGVARMVSVGGGNEEVGRFGWKAQVPHLEDFTRDAMGGELGMTTPADGRGFAFTTDSDSVADPELTLQEVADVTFFMAELGPPLRTFSADPDVAAGEGLFTTIGCAICHTPQLQGASGLVPLYSNLLLHNVMPADFRGMAEPDAGAGFFKTPPLWGIKDTAPYMHDGRGETLHGAILRHDGEAAAVRAAYQALPSADQAKLIAFLNDL